MYGPPEWQQTAAEEIAVLAVEILSNVLRTRWIAGDTNFTPAEGETLFWDRWPEDPDEAIVLVGVASPEATYTFGEDPAVRRARVQVYARARTRSQARLISGAAEAALLCSDQVTTLGTVLRCQPVTEFHLASYDPKDRPVTMQTLNVWFTP